MYLLLRLRPEGYLDLLLNEPPSCTQNPKGIWTDPPSFLTRAHHVTHTLNIFNGCIKLFELNIGPERVWYLARKCKGWEGRILGWVDWGDII